MNHRFATTYEYLQYWEIKSPDAIALINHTTKISYARFVRDLRRFIQEFSEWGIGYGDVVLVSCADVYIHWQMILALENLGAVSASVVIPDQPLAPKMYQTAKFIITENPLDLLPGQQMRMISQEWITSVLARPARDLTDILHPIALQDGARMVGSSGTTGEPKVMILSHAFQEERMRMNMDFSGLTRETRMLIAAPYSINTSYTRMVNCLRIGAQLLTGPLPEMLRDHQPTFTWMMPVQIETLLKELPDDFSKSSNLTLITGGAALSPKLRERILERIATRVTCNFGANECGTLFSVDPQGRGLLLPGVYAQVVDDEKKPLPLGQPGLLGLRSPVNIDGYVDNPEADARLIHEGWYYTGDMAVMTSSRTLRLLGRHDEVLNLGGVKIPPELIEEQVMVVDGIAEVAALSDTQPGTGVARLCLAIVAKPDADRQKILKDVPNVVNVPASQLIMRLVPSLPYTNNGKLKRNALRGLFDNKV